VYARTVGSRELTFGVSGMLWRENLVMYDRLTDSWWAQALGLAIHGEYEGTELEMYPSHMMTWTEWVKLHPDTLVLAKPPGGRGAARSMRDGYARYHSSENIGVTGYTRFTGRDVDAKAIVLGFRIDDLGFAVMQDQFDDVSAFVADAADTQVVIAATPDRSGFRVFRAGGQRFEASTRGAATTLVDRATGSEWDPFEGRAVRGALAGRQLEEIPSTLSYWFAWRAFFPTATFLTR
jgi:hypothetical protein